MERNINLLAHYRHGCQSIEVPAKIYRMLQVIKLDICHVRWVKNYGTTITGPYMNNARQKSTIFETKKPT